MPDAFSAIIGYTFSDPGLLVRALTHSSAKGQADNERLEFLGDRVLGLAVASLLFHLFAEEAEGSLAKRHTGLVQQAALVRVAKEIDLAASLKLSHGEAKSGGAKKNKILADAMEALIGAIYLDGGFEAATGFVHRFWTPALKAQTAPPEDAKSQLQEWAQGLSLPLPEYKTVSKSGRDHAPLFEVSVSVKGRGAASATAASKRAAEKEAARRLLVKAGVITE